MVSENLPLFIACGVMALLVVVAFTAFILLYLEEQRLRYKRRRPLYGITFPHDDDDDEEFTISDQDDIPVNQTDRGIRQ